MLAYRKWDGTLVHVTPELQEEEEPLFQAIRAGDVGRLKALIASSRTDLMPPSKPGWLAIHQATWLDQEACLRVLLAAQPGLVNKRTEHAETALLLAVDRELLPCARLLLENGADPDAPNRDHETPLYKACERDNPALVALLLNHGAAVNTKCFQGWTALHEAASRNVEICQMLLKAAGKHSPVDKYGITPLFIAAQSGQVAPLRLLLRHGADINSQAADGATALHEAAKNGHVEIVDFLLSQKADANITGKAGLLPLHVAARKENETIVSMLIPATSKARVRRTGISPLHVASEHNRDGVLETLIRAGFDVNAQLCEERRRLYEDRRSTALYLAVANYNVDNVRSLLHAGADPNLDVFGPLLLAARQGCIESVTLLVEHGADINARIATHPTTFPAIFMFSMKYLPMFKYLLDNGGDALSCFQCVYGSGPHPPLQTSRSHPGHLEYSEERRPAGGVTTVLRSDLRAQHQSVGGADHRRAAGLRGSRDALLATRGAFGQLRRLERHQRQSRVAAVPAAVVPHPDRAAGGAAALEALGASRETDPLPAAPGIFCGFVTPRSTFLPLWDWLEMRRGRRRPSRVIVQQMIGSLA
ncbi:ankyrin repeat and SOCS box protein 2-like isoform X1 [Vanacampus margaritifer]